LKHSAKATSIGPAAFNALRLSDSGEVHSVFERTFNILIGGELVGVARSGVARSPINVITDISAANSMSALGLRKDARVQISGDQVLVGDVLEISLKDAKIWQPKTHAEGCPDPELVRRNLELAERLAADKARREGLGQLLPSVGDIALGAQPQTSNLNQVAKRALPQIVGLVKSVKTGNVAGVKQHGGNLVGLGLGLSPSADDMLSGFMVARWWIANSLSGNLSQVKVENEAIVESVEKTTLISQQLLRHAAKGETNEAVEGLLEAILAGTAADVEAGVGRVSVIGETSGIDMMVGLLLGLQLELGMKN